MRRLAVAAALLALAACTPAPPLPAAGPSCAAPLKPALQVDLYFGAVSDREWTAFLDEEVTPRFPAGLSVIDLYGQYRNQQGAIGRERAKLLVIVVFDAPAHAPRVQAIVDSYLRRHGQESVLRVERAICAGL